MCSLGMFSSPPPALHHRTVCEKDGHLLATSPTSAAAGSQNIAHLVSQVSSYPEVCISRSQLHPHASKDSLKTAFLVDAENHWARVVTTLNEHGVVCALEEFVADKQNAGTSWLIRAVEIALSVIRRTRIVHGSIYPHFMLSTDEVLEKFTQASDWRDGLIRCFVWHPHTAVFAFALRDDTVRILGSIRSVNPALKHRQQRKVADLAWRPLSGSTLAVACQLGVLVWYVDPMSLVTRPSSACTQLLSRKGHTPVTSVQWSPCGRLLVSASPLDSAMIVWEVSTLMSIPLKRVAGGGVSLLRWSPNGHLLFAATPSKIFRVWETRTWNSDWWSTGSGHCVAACWSPDGSVLLTAMQNEPIVYSLSFAESDDEIGGSKTAIPFINLATTLFESSGSTNKLNVGGPVQSMVWDKTGQRLAVSFSCQESRQELVALFRTRTKPVLEISPCGFIRGGHGEVPQCMHFQDGFVGGALLTVCWSSGEVSHIPLIFPTVPESSLECSPDLDDSKSARTIYSMAEYQ